MMIKHLQIRFVYSPIHGHQPICPLPGMTCAASPHPSAGTPQYAMQYTYLPLAPLPPLPLLPLLLLPLPLLLLLPSLRLQLTQP